MGKATLASWLTAGSCKAAPGVHNPKDMVEKWPKEGLVREQSDHVLGVGGGLPKQEPSSGKNQGSVIGAVSQKLASS